MKVWKISFLYSCFLIIKHIKLRKTRIYMLKNTQNCV